MENRQKWLLYFVPYVISIRDVAAFLFLNVHLLKMMLAYHQLTFAPLVVWFLDYFALSWCFEVKIAPL